MQSPLERRGLGCALLAALLSLGGTMLAAMLVKAMPGSGAAPASTAGMFSEIALSPELTNKGRVFFEMSCSHCHGDDARGDEGPDLHNLPISNARIAATIKKGIKGQMPAFAKKYGDPQTAALVSYLRSLR